MSEIYERLTTENIDRTVAEIKDYSQSVGQDNRHCLWLGLYAEEVLLNYLNACNAVQYMVKQKKTFSNLLTEIYVVGAQMDLINAGYSENGVVCPELLMNLMNTSDALTGYSYRSGVNVITISQRIVSVKKPSPLKHSIISILMAAACAIFILQLPEEIRTEITDGYVHPVFSALMALLKGITMPVILVSLVTGICAFGDLQTFYKTGKKTITRFLLLTVLMYLLTVAVSFLFFRSGDTQESSFRFSQFLTLLLGVIPSDLFSPLLEGNAVQIVVIGILSGIVLLELGEKTRLLRNAVGELKAFFFRFMDIITALVPVILFLSILESLLTVDLSAAMDVWRIVVADLLCTVLFSLIMLLWISKRNAISMRKLFNCFRGAMIISFSTAGSSASIPEFFRAFKDELGADPAFADCYVPLSVSLFSPSTIIPMIIYAFFTAELYGITISTGWLLVLLLMVVLLGIATPKIPGGMLATLAILMAQLGMPNDSIGLLMLANVIILNFCCGFAALVRGCEGVNLGIREKAINPDMLR